MPSITNFVAKKPSVVVTPAATTPAVNSITPAMEVLGNRAGHLSTLHSKVLEPTAATSDAMPGYIGPFASSRLAQNDAFLLFSLP